MVSFSFIDIFIIALFFLIILIIGFLPKKEKEGDISEYLLSGRKVGLWLFVLNNVSTWYGGILGVGEFTYQYGLLSWFTQGLPYYIFAIIFALIFAEKIRNASFFTIPDKIEHEYGKTAGIISSILIFILVTPAPYLLMIGSLLHLIFNINLFWGLIIAALSSSIYLIKGGYKSDLYTDVFQFFVMFTGFALIVIISFLDVGDFNFLKNNLPDSHLSPTGNASIIYVIVWFLIALWTFADPGFHQRCNAAKDGKTARNGILISVIFWLIFDFLTTTTGLFSRAVIPDLNNPVLAFPLYAEKILSSGLKGIFFAALFATIISTSNSFLFLSGTTFGRDIIFKSLKVKNEKRVPYYTRIGIILSSILSILLAYNVQSVIYLWYLIGSICIPGIIILIFSAYYKKYKVPNNVAVVELVAGVLTGLIWLIIEQNLSTELKEIEPMIVGLLFVVLIHIVGIKIFKMKASYE
ncbi:sodium:solute symporter family protein [Rosettibacter firmus]|uniref:sodium:solute symporter family protein n=1 Tax=Rosettibacter firmus TaxID=3111522 RepID=UPI00336C0A6D